MHDTEFVIRARRKWVELYAATRNAPLVCRSCGIRASTLRKWRRFQAEGEAGLHSRSNRPQRSPARKLTEEHISRVIEMRSKRDLGRRRIQAELGRLHYFKLSLATIWKVLNRHGMNRLRGGCAARQPKSHSRDVPGERVQLDTMKVAQGLFRFTAVDGCTRMRVIALYLRRTAQNAVRFSQGACARRVPVSNSANPDLPRRRIRRYSLPAVDDGSGHQVPAYSSVLAVPEREG